MRSVVIALFIIATGLIGRSQGSRLNFETGLSWQQILVKAKIENKLIFVDCYATWCGPCKMMDAQIFPRKDVGGYFNSHFINVRIQMDQTSHDNIAVKEWYQTAKEFQTNYTITAYPTYLFFSSDGQPIHRFSGGSPTGEDFIERGSAALNPDKQYYFLIKNWEKHKTDAAFLRNTIDAAKAVEDFTNAHKISGYYYDCLTKPVSIDNIITFNSLINSETDKAFKLYVENAAEIDRLMDGQYYVEEKSADIIFDAELRPLFYKKKGSFNWTALAAQTTAKYPTLNKEAFISFLNNKFQKYIGSEIKELTDKSNLKPNDWEEIYVKLKSKYPGQDFGLTFYGFKMDYYLKRKNGQECAKSAVYLMENYASSLGDKGFNNISWDYVLVQTGDKKILEKAIRCMEPVIRRNLKDPQYLDTYANLMYRAGHADEAKSWEAKAVQSAEENKSDSKDIRDNLEKMNNGKPTWEPSSSGT